MYPNTPSTNLNLDDSLPLNNRKYFEFQNFFKKIRRKIDVNCKNCFKKNPIYINEPNSKRNHKVKKVRKTIFNEIISIILFMISYFFYFLSLKRCYDGEDACPSNTSWITFIIVTCSISIVINTVLFALMIYNKISSLNLIHFTIIYILFYVYSHDAICEDHGYYNFVAFFSLLWFSILMVLFIHGIIIFAKSRYKYFFFTILLLIIIFSIIIYYINPINCDDWTLGLNNTCLENDINKYGCQIILPKACTYKILSSTQDFSKITNLDCTIGKRNARKTLLEIIRSPYVNKITKRFGFPKTNNDEVGGLDGKDRWVLLNYTYENVIDMDYITKDLKYYPEKIVDFTKNENGELIVNLTYNDSLSKERKKLEKNVVPYSNNIMILYFDSVSRPNALRQLKKTMSFIEKFMTYNGSYHEKFPNENYHSFQFFKYHAFKMFTPGNFPRLFYGNKREVNDLVLITKYLKENGFVTNYCGEECRKDNTRTFHNMTKSEMYDHQMLLCDPNVVEMNKPVKKCLYGNIDTYHLYEYGKQFWVKYKDNRKFSALVTNDAHESSLETLKYSDEIIYNYLTYLYNKNLLKDTTIFLVCDHGATLPSIYYLDDFFQIEGRLPMLFIIVNDRKNVSYYDQYYHLHKNQQTFVTAYDFYNTVAHLLYGDKYVDIKNKTDDHDTPKSPLGQSLFNYIDPMSRNPKNYESMDTKYCK